MKTVNRRRTSASNNRAHAELDSVLKRKLQNPEFRAAYEAEDQRIELALQIIKLRERRGMTQADLAKAIGSERTAAKSPVYSPKACLNDFICKPENTSEPIANIWPFVTLPGGKGKSAPLPGNETLC